MEQGSTNEIKAVILAAGKGTRMKSELPKVLHQIFQKPMLSWVVDAVNNLDCKTQTITVVGHKSELVQEYLKKNYDNAKTVLQAQQLGTGHAVASAVSEIGDFDGCVLILCGDTPLITTSKLKSFVEAHELYKNDITVMTCDFDDPTGYGRIVRDENGNVVKIVEQKDATQNEKQIKEINSGIYCLNWAKVKHAFCELKNNNAQGEYYLTDIIEWANSNNLKVGGWVNNDNREIFGVNSKKHLSMAFKMMNERYIEKLLDDGVTVIDPNSTYITPETTIGADTIIYPNTYIEGKNKIAANCKIGPMAHLRGNCEIEENVKIGNFVELKNAKIAKNSHVCHLTYVGDAIIGANVNIGAGTIFANYNSITKEKKVSKLSNGVSIGSNTVLVAPVEIGENALVAASSCITKNIEANSLALTRSPQKEVKNWVENKKRSI